MNLPHFILCLFGAQTRWLNVSLGIGHRTEETADRRREDELRSGKWMDGNQGQHHQDQHPDDDEWKRRASFSLDDRHDDEAPEWRKRTAKYLLMYTWKRERERERERSSKPKEDDDKTRTRIGLQSAETHFHPLSSNIFSLSLSPNLEAFIPNSYTLIQCHCFQLLYSRSPPHFFGSFFALCLPLHPLHPHHPSPLCGLLTSEEEGEKNLVNQT